MARTLASLMDAARAEWDHWGRSTWNLIPEPEEKQIGHTDDEDEYADYIIHNYCRPRGDHPSRAEIVSDHYYWSAVGLSAIFEKAGFAAADFPFSNRHSTWITRFIAARRAGEPALYHGHRLNRPSATPDIGDIVGFAGGSFDEAQGYFDRQGSYSSHSDLVVARRDGEIDVIGANVLDSVTQKTLQLDENGLIADRNFNWFVVLKLQL